MKRVAPDASLRRSAVAKYRARDRQLSHAIVHLTTDLVNTVTSIERVVLTAQRCAGMALRDAREATGLSLREAARGIRLSPAALLQLERGKSWESRTAKRAIQFLSTVQ